MNNDLSNDITQNYNFDFKNPLVAVTTILTIGICYCVTVTVNAKYNRDIEITRGDTSLKIHG